MNNNTTLVWQLKRDILLFSEKISDGITRPMMKFVAQMLFGLLTSQSIFLTDIGRALQEDISLKKTEDRLSRNLKAFYQDTCCIRENYLEIVKPLVDDDTIFCLDPGDICKKYSRHQEGLGWIHDGSTHKPALGWQLIEVTALTHGKKLPIPVYMELSSPSDPMEDTQSEAIISAIRSTQQTFGVCGIFTMDRGMDTNDIYKHCIQSHQNFIIRAKVNRNLILDGEEVEITKATECLKGKFRLDHTDKYGKYHHLKASFRPVKLPCCPNVPLTLVAVYGWGEEPMLLLTNMPIKGKETCLRVVKTYLCRWRIEEYYRFKKKQFNLEDIRVQSIESIRALAFLVSVLSGWIAMFANKQGASLLLEKTLIRAKRVYEIPKFTLYAVSDGIFDILKFATRGILFALVHPPRSQQLSFFKPDAFNYSAV